MPISQSAPPPPPASQFLYSPPIGMIPQSIPTNLPGAFPQLFSDSSNSRSENLDLFGEFNSSESSLRPVKENKVEGSLFDIDFHFSQPDTKIEPKITATNNSRDSRPMPEKIGFMTIISMQKHTNQEKWHLTT